MTCRNFDENDFRQCNRPPKVKGRFGLAWVFETPSCPCPEPKGWKVEFVDTPSKVEQRCQDLIAWVNCPPLPRCEPCPPEELRCRKCSCSGRSSSPKKKTTKKRCSYCEKKKAKEAKQTNQCYCCRHQSPKRC